MRRPPARRTPRPPRAWTSRAPTSISTTTTASKQDFVRVVFRTADDLPRRSDGAIQAGISIDGISHSIGSAKKGAPIYTGAAEVKGNSITALNGKLIRKGAKVGRSFTVRFFTRDGQHVTKKMTLRAERKGDDTGRPLSR